MVEKQVGFNIFARDNASREFAKVGESAERSGRGVGILSAHFGHFGAAVRTGAGIALGAAGLGGLIEGFKGFYAEARESQKVGAQTAAAIKSTGGAAHVTADQIGTLTTAISNKVGVDDEAIQTGANLLLTFTGIRNEAGKGNDIFNQATATITDMTAAMNGGVVSQEGLKASAIQVGKALNDPIKGMTALAKVGVTFTKQQKDQIAALVGSGHSLDAQKVILKELNKEFGGSAAAGSTATQKLGVAFGNIKEQLGNYLLPVIDKAASWFASKLPGAMDVATRAFGVIKTGIAAMVSAFQEGDVTSTGFVGTMENIGVQARHAFDTFRTEILPALKNFAGFVIGTVIPTLVTFGGWLIKYRGWLIPIAGGITAVAAAVKIATEVTKAWAIAQKILNVVMALNPFALVVLALVGLGAALYIAWKKSETFRDVVKGVWTAVQQAFGNAVGAIIQFAIHPIVSAFLWMAENITGLAAKAFGWVPGLGPKLKGAHQAVEDFKAGVDNTLTRLANTAYGLGDNAGRSIGQGLTDGIHSKIPAVRAAANLLAYTASRSVIDHVRPGSPSKLFREIGQMVGEGFALGHEDSYGRVAAAARGMAAAGTAGAMSVPAGGQIVTGRANSGGYGAVGRDDGRPVTIVLQLDGQPIARSLARLNRNGATIIKLTT